jgi:hypothetical protein
MSPENPIPLEQEAEPPCDWTRLGICFALQPLLWGLRIEKDWRAVAVEIGPLRFTVQWP